MKRTLITVLAVVAGGAALSLFGGTARAAVGGAVCNVPTDYSTIQAAVSDPGCTTVNVAAGTYTENVTIGHSLILNGAQAGTDARTRSGSESAVTGTAGAAITINANNVTVDGFTLNGAAGQGTVFMLGGNTGETIQNNVFNTEGTAAFFNTSNTMFKQNRVNFTATATDGFQANSTPVTNVTVADNTFGGADPNGLNADITFIEGNANITVSGNKSVGDGTLIALFKTNGAQITGNTVIGDPNSSAIYIGGADNNVTVSGNDVQSAGTGVNVANDFGDGVNASVTITGNNLHANSSGVKVKAGAVTAANAVVVHTNQLTGNTAFGVNNLSSFNVDATCNWWGAANGPGPVGPGSGDKVTTNVTFSPWLLSANGSCAGGLSEKACKQAVEQQKKNFDAQQKADKVAFNATSHTEEQKKAFDDQQKAAKKAFEQQNKADKEQCEGH